MESRRSPWLRAVSILSAALLLGSLASCGQAEMIRLYFANNGTEVRLDSPLPLRLPYTEHEGWIVVQASVNGSPPVPFVLDTGASMLTILTAPDTEALGLDMGGLRRIGGEGVSAITAAVQQGLELDFGPLALLDQTVLAIPMDNILCSDQVRPPPFRGVIGHELFGRYVVEVDHARGEVVLHDPADFEYRGDGVELPIEISARHAYVRSQVQAPDGAAYEARLHVDTGAGIHLSLFPQAHEAIVVPAGGEDVAGCFVGGLASYRRGEPVRLGLGQAPPVEVPVRYSTGDEVIKRGQHGRLGARFLADYNVVYDFPGKRIILAPRAVTPSITGSAR